MGMEVYGYDPYISVSAAWSLSRSVKHISNVEDIYRECDYITIHVPLLDSTRKMIGADAIAMMKPTAIVLNFARDLLVDEEAMVDALCSGQDQKICLDFPNTTTVGAKGCIVTPHLGASTAESEDNCALMAVREIRDYLENGNIVHSVNFPDCSMGACMTAGRIGILHKNESGMLSHFTTILGNAGINIDGMANKSRGDYAYALIDVDTNVPEDVLAKAGADGWGIKSTESKITRCENNGRNQTICKHQTTEREGSRDCCLPYDVYNREEATKEVERHPQSFLSIDRAETQFPLSVDMYDDKVYERAHDTLWQWVENGTFLTEDKKCYYLYELTMNGRVQTGVAACASIDDYENGIIKKHENTRAEKEGRPHPPCGCL